jgi:hypothetical protein
VNRIRTHAETLTRLESAYEASIPLAVQACWNLSRLFGSAAARLRGEARVLEAERLSRLSVGLAGIRDEQVAVPACDYMKRILKEFLAKRRAKT